MSKFSQVKYWLAGLLALLSPGAATPKTPVRRDEPTSAVEKDLEEEIDLDESYNQEQFYRGMPIFNKKGQRDFLRPGRSYTDGVWFMPGGNALMIYIDQAAPSTTIEGPLGNVRFLDSAARKKFLKEMKERNT